MESKWFVTDHCLDLYGPFNCEDDAQQFINIQFGYDATMSVIRNKPIEKDWYDYVNEYITKQAMLKVEFNSNL